VALTAALGFRLFANLARVLPVFCNIYTFQLLCAHTGHTKRGFERRSFVLSAP
jgi:hypothetical protein